MHLTRAIGVTALALVLAGCGSKAAKTGAIAPARKYEPFHYLPEGSTVQKGAPFEYMGRQVIIATCQTLDAAGKMHTGYAIGTADHTQWYSGHRLIAYVEGVGFVVPLYKDDAREPSTFFVYTPQSGMDIKSNIKALLTAGEPDSRGRVDRTLILFADKDGDTRAELRDRDGKLIYKADYVMQGDAKQWVEDFGAFYMIFPQSASDHRMTLMIDRRLNLMGKAALDIEEFRMNLVAQEKQRKSYFGVAVEGEKHVFKLLQQDGTFAAPPGVIGVTPLASAGVGLWDFYNSASWLVLHDTPQGRRWGYANTDFTQVSPPLWSDVKRIDGPQMAKLRMGYALEEPKEKLRRSYLVVQDIATRQWHALVPEYPYQALTSKPTATAEQTVAEAEAVCTQKIGEIRLAEQQRLAAIAKKKAEEVAAAKARRIKGGATKEKDDEWYDAVNHSSWGGYYNDLTPLARKLGGVYWVDWIDKGYANTSENLKSAAAAAEKFDPERAKLLHARAANAAKREAEIARLNEEARKAAHERMLAEAREAAAPRRSSQSSDFGWDFSGSAPRTYDYRTGIRSDTQSLQNWTYGQQDWHWKPASR